MGVKPRIGHDLGNTSEQARVSRARYALFPQVEMETGSGPFALSRARMLKHLCQLRPRGLRKDRPKLRSSSKIRRAPKEANELDQVASCSPGANHTAV